MDCYHCRGIEEVFDKNLVSKELQRYHKQGARKTTRILIEALKEVGVQEMTLLDIGGGIGAIQHGLLDAGVRNATDIDASRAYLNAAKDEAQRRGFAEHTRFQHGNFIDVAADLPVFDIVTLDRVICCYPDMEKLVDLSASRANKLYGVVYPRDDWWVKIGLSFLNFGLKMQKSPFRTFVHPTKEVESLINCHGFKRRFYYWTMIWQVAVYEK